MFKNYKCANNNIGDNMENTSLWNSLKLCRYKEKDIKKTDILIIGAGLTGVMTAYFLKDSNKKVTIIDKGSVGRGVTTNSTAKISYIQRDVYQKLNKNFNFETSKLYFESQMDATNIILDIVNKYKIDCDLKEVNSYLFSSTKAGINKVEKEMNILEKLGVECYKVQNLPIDFPCENAFYVKNTYVFHPLKFIYGVMDILKDRVIIKENTLALEVQKKDDEYVVFTNNGIIKTKKLIIACHYPFFIFPSLIPLKNHIEREYVNCGKFDCKEDFAAINVEKNVHSIRFYKDYLIYVSNNHKIHNNITYKKNFIKSQKDFNKYFNSDSVFTWENQDLFSSDNLPLIGIASKNQPDLYIACCYNGWGMTNATIAGKVLSDLCLNRNNKYEKLFSVSRVNLPVILKSPNICMGYLKAYVETVFYKNESFYTKVIDGKKYNVYKDKFGCEHIVERKCPHLKCNLIFNEKSLSWDCPCHGSRFDIDGNVIEGPSKYSIKYECKNKTE